MLFRDIVIFMTCYCVSGHRCLVLANLLLYTEQGKHVLALGVGYIEQGVLICIV